MLRKPISIISLETQNTLFCMEILLYLGALLISLLFVFLILVLILIYDI